MQLAVVLDGPGRLEDDAAGLAGCEHDVPRSAFVADGISVFSTAPLTVRWYATSSAASFRSRQRATRSSSVRTDESSGRVGAGI
jgi:hypothetical protein